MNIKIRAYANEITVLGAIFGVVSNLMLIISALFRAPTASFVSAVLLLICLVLVIASLVITEIKNSQ